MCTLSKLVSSSSSSPAVSIIRFSSDFSLCLAIYKDTMNSNTRFEENTCTPFFEKKSLMFMMSLRRKSIECGWSF